MLSGGGRRLAGAARRVIGNRRHFLHPSQHFLHALGLILRLGGERRGELYRRIQVGKNGIERALDGAGDGADPAGCLAPLLHGIDNAIDLILRRADFGPHLFRRSRALLGELANLASHDAEAEPMLSRARRLDGGVERQQVGLARDARDPVHELADLTRLAVERTGHLGGVIHVDHQIHQK